MTADGAAFPVLLFVRDVASHYLHHPSSEVRREAALSCCTLLIPREISAEMSADGEHTLVHHDSQHAIVKRKLGSYSGRVVEDVVSKLLQASVSDLNPMVRLSVIRALDGRYDYFLSQSHHLQPLFFVLQDEVLAIRAAGLRLLGRLARLNPAPILSLMRQFLVDLVLELKCGGETGRGREEATRLLIVFLKAETFHRLVQPVLPSVVEALPLTGVAPRLASFALEALGELAEATQASFQPIYWFGLLIERCTRL